MLFNSIEFLIFCPIVFFMYWIIPARLRWAVVLISSYYFYMCWNEKYIFLIFFTTVVTYVCARLLGKCRNERQKKSVITISSLVCIGVLFVFKYFNFMIEVVCDVLNYFRLGDIRFARFELMLPVGISFYTFQTLSYVIDVYRGDIEAEEHFGLYAAYISFFPQLVAGPIERAANLLPQIKQKKKFDYEQATYGLKLIAWGLFKKMLIADLLAGYVDQTFGDVYSYKGLALVIASVFFTFQIYCDFSGYSDMAVGIAKLFGIDIMYNFKAPFYSKSIKEFWCRWHISLSTWFRDYLYIPLGGNRCSKFRNSINLMITFLVSGLWHGANWTYIIWGGLHGLTQVLEKKFMRDKALSKGLKEIVRNIIVFTIVVVAFVYFRSESLTDATYVIGHYMEGIWNPMQYIKDGYIALEITWVKFIKLALPILILLVYDFYSLKMDVIQVISESKLVVRWSIYVLFSMFVLFYIQYFLGTGKVAQKFIYFDF